jgi:hypothetical protein
MANDAGITSILETYHNPASLIDSLTTLRDTTLIAEVIAPIFFFLALALMFVTTWIKQGHKGKFMDTGEIKRLIIVMILIPAVPLLFTFIQQIGWVCAKAMEMDAGDKFAGISKLWDQMNSGPEDEISLWSLTLGMQYKLMAMFLMVLAILLMYIVKFVIILFSGVFIQFCIIVSPLAMAFSILPIFKDQVEKLLQVFFNVCFVGLTMNILDHMFFDSLFEKIIGALNDPLADIFNYIMVAATCFTIVIFYLLSFWLTAKYVGSPGAAAIMSTAVTATTMAVMAGASAFGAVSGAGKAAAGASPEANIVKSAAQSIKKE